MSTVEAGIETVADAVQLYIDGVASGNAAALERAFHPDARMWGSIGGQRYDIPIAEMIGLVVSQPADVDGSFRASIREVTEVGDAAAAVVDEENFWGGMSFVDFFSLARIDGSWRIVGKTFAHTGGTPAG